MLNFSDNCKRFKTFIMENILTRKIKSSKVEGLDSEDLCKLIINYFRPSVFVKIIFLCYGVYTVRVLVTLHKDLVFSICELYVLARNPFGGESLWNILLYIPIIFISFIAFNKKYVTHKYQTAKLFHYLNAYKTDDIMTARTTIISLDLKLKSVEKSFMIGLNLLSILATFYIVGYSHEIASVYISGKNLQSSNNSVFNYFQMIVLIFFAFQFLIKIIVYILFERNLGETACKLDMYFIDAEEVK